MTGRIPRPLPVMTGIASLSALLLLTSACAAPVRATTLRLLQGEDAESVDRGAPIASVDACNGFTGPADLDPSRPLTLLVHGCRASSSRLRDLSDVLRSQGEQTLCFSYDYRDRLARAAAELDQAIAELSSHISELRIIAHSMGGLVARRALTEHHGSDWEEDVSIRLVTVSTPFGGIRAARSCGVRGLHVISLGLTAGVCRAITGTNWRDIHPRADFIEAPGVMRPQVVEHLRVATNEEGSCRFYDDDGACEEDDYVFSVLEQFEYAVDRDARVRERVIDAGHAEVIGMDGRPPWALVELLVAERLLSRDALTKGDSLADVMRATYGDSRPMTDL